MKEQLILTLPFPEGEIAECVQAMSQKPSHDIPSTEYAYDFFNPEKPLEVCASADGVAYVKSGSPEGLTHFNKGFGNIIKIDHGNGTYTLYAHLSEIAVENGQKVKRGEKIGVEDATGMAGSRHLHWSLHRGSAKEDKIYPSIVIDKIYAKDITVGEELRVFKGTEIVGGRGQMGSGGHVYRCVHSGETN